MIPISETHYDGWPACPFCDAPCDEPCRTRSGRYARNPHTARLTLRVRARVAETLERVADLRKG